MSDAFARALQNPSSVRARRELADYWRSIQDPRLELVERQLNQLDQVGFLEELNPLTKIERLVTKRGREWAGPIVDRVLGYSFEFGLVARITVSGESFVNTGNDLVGLAPIVHLGIEAPVDLVALSRVPALSQIRTLRVEPGTWLNDEAVCQFAESPMIENLRAITFCGGVISDRGSKALARSAHLANLVYVELTGNPCSEGSCGREIEGRYYLIGAAAQPYLDRAHDAAAVSYDPNGLHEWPPTDVEISYDDRSAATTNDHEGASR